MGTESVNLKAGILQRAHEYPGLSLLAPTDLIRVAKEFGFEGIVAKRKDSFYESGKRTGFAC